MLKFSLNRLIGAATSSKLLFVIIFIAAHQVTGAATESSAEKELILTQTEMVALEKLKAEVYQNLTKDFEYMKQDLFLLRWLRAKNLDVNRTKRDLLNFMKFREENRIKDFLSQDWSDLFSEPPFHIDAFDKEGRPIAYVSLAEGWDVRNLLLNGKRNRLSLYIVNIAFEIGETLIDINRQQPNITQFLFLLNLDTFNAVQHACPICLSVYLDLLQTYERFLPGFAHRVVILNAPSILTSIREVLRTVVSERTRNVLKVFGTNRNKWKPFLDSIIDPGQLPPEFGGTKTS